MQSTTIDNLLNQKKAAKAELSRELSLSKNKPLLGIFLDKALTDESEMQQIMDALSAVEVEVVILADSNLDALDMTKVLPYGRENRKKLLDAADIALIFEFSDVQELLLNGIIPVSCERPGVIDYNPNRETGNSFVYRHKSPWGIFAALVRAIETFKFPYDWKHIVRQGVDSVSNTDL